MTEPEIDALMAGQEDENGSVHYEGKLGFPSMPSLSLSLFFFASMQSVLTYVCLCPAFVKHIMSV